MSSKPRIGIVVDVHERASGIPASLERLGALIEVASLPAGDYAVGSETIVERKSVLDLHGAILKGRLWPQLGKLRTECEFPYLLVEGRDLDRGPLHPNAIRGACLAAIDQGIALLRTEDPADSARWLHRLAVRCQRVEEAPDRPAYAQRPTAVPGIRTAEAMLATVPGISTASARALLLRFGSVHGVFQATGKSWSQCGASGLSGRERSRRRSASRWPRCPRLVPRPRIPPGSHHSGHELVTESWPVRNLLQTTHVMPPLQGGGHRFDPGILHWLDLEIAVVKRDFGLGGSLEAEREARASSRHGQPLVVTQQ